VRLSVCLCVGVSVCVQNLKKLWTDFDEFGGRELGVAQGLID